MLDPGKFPRDIRHWIWANYQYYVDQEYRLLCQMENGLYGFFHANACYTGFDNDYSSHMSLYLAPEPESLIFFAMDDYTYRLYEKDTTPAPAWSSWDAATAERRLAWAMLGHVRLGAAARPWAAAVGGDADALGAVGRGILAPAPVAPAAPAAGAAGE
jgi:hypothetical protein